MLSLSIFFQFRCRAELQIAECADATLAPGSNTHTHILYIQLHALFLFSPPHRHNSVMFVLHDSCLPSLSLTPLHHFFLKKVLGLWFCFLSCTRSPFLGFFLSFPVKRRNAELLNCRNPFWSPLFTRTPSPLHGPPRLRILQGFDLKLTLAHTRGTVDSHSSQNEAAATHVPIRTLLSWV